MPLITNPEPLITNPKPQIGLPNTIGLVTVVICLFVSFNLNLQYCHQRIPYTFRAIQPSNSTVYKYLFWHWYWAHTYATYSLLFNGLPCLIDHINHMPIPSTTTRISDFEIILKLTLTTRALVLPNKIVLVFSKFKHFTGYFRNYWTNTRHVGIYLIAFLMVIPNMVIKFNNFDIFYKIC